MLAGDVEQKGFRVTGRVQGVYYRVWARGVGEDLGLRGTIRNRGDGSVEAHVAGSPDAVRAFEDLLWVGPPDAAVESVEVLESPLELPGDAFEILATAR